MASNQTPVYGLNQWQLSDDVRMEEFNNDNAKIEQALVDAKVHFQSGSYVGTGTYGPDAPNSLTFDFEPQLLIVAPESKIDEEVALSVTMAESVVPLIAIRGATAATASYDSNLHGANFEPMKTTLLWNGNTVSWYNYHRTVPQYNCLNTTYRYLAIG